MCLKNNFYPIQTPSSTKKTQSYIPENLNNQQKQNPPRFPTHEEGKILQNCCSPTNTQIIAFCFTSYIFYLYYFFERWKLHNFSFSSLSSPLSWLAWHRRGHWLDRVSDTRVDILTGTVWNVSHQIRILCDTFFRLFRCLNELFAVWGTPRSGSH